MGQYNIVINETPCLPNTLEELILSDVIRGEKFFDSLRSLQNLRKLNLSNMILRSCDVQALARVLANFGLLENLILADVNVSGADWEIIFRAMNSLTNIKVLHLDGVNVSDGNEMSEMLSSLLFLESLVLVDMRVGDRNHEKIFQAMKKLRNLRKLHLRGVSTNAHDFNTLFSAPSFSLLEELEFSQVLVKEHLNVHELRELKYLKAFSLKTIWVSPTGESALAFCLPYSCWKR